MELWALPVNQWLGIEERDGGLWLPATDRLGNHVGSVHAGVQFAFAEAASGWLLQRRFAEYAGRVMPVLREAQVRYRRQAHGALQAMPGIDETEAEQFLVRLERRGRAPITVTVRLDDTTGETVFAGTYQWFVAIAAGAAQDT